MSDTEKSFQSEHASPATTTGMAITLQVGERRFITTKETITQESGFFAALLSGRWDNAQADGSYFIDADPNLFEHIIRYLRRRVLPIFYDNIKGHDHALYLALLEEAQYFQIPRLETWLKGRGYLQTIKIRYSVHEVEGFAALSNTLGTDEQLEYHPIWQTIKVYICPRGISNHKGNRGACGRQCRNAQGEEETEYEDEPVLKTLVIRKETLINQAACTEGRD